MTRAYKLFFVFCNQEAHLYIKIIYSLISYDDDIRGSYSEYQMSKLIPLPVIFK